MTTAFWRLATACPLTGFTIRQRGGFPFQGQPAKLKLEARSWLYAGLVHRMKSDKLKGATELSKKCDDQNELCPDPCIVDEEMERIAEHIGARCPKHPCSKVQDPCMELVKMHIGLRKPKTAAPTKPNTPTKTAAPTKTTTKASTPKKAVARKNARSSSRTFAFLKNAFQKKKATEKKTKPKAK